jgi:hypothetical protein
MEIRFKIFDNPDFEKENRDYFFGLLRLLEDNNLISYRISEIIITDRIEDEIKVQSKNKNEKFTKEREFFAVSKIICTRDDKEVIIFDSTKVNIDYKISDRVFIEQILCFYSEDFLKDLFEVPKIFYLDTPFNEITRILVGVWVRKIITKIILNNTFKDLYFFPSNIKDFVDAFKRSVRRLNYKYQDDQDIKIFWIDLIKLTSFFIERCIDVKYEYGNFDDLQEFNNFIPTLLSEIENQAQNIISKNDVSYSIIEKQMVDILEICNVKLLNKDRVEIKIIDSPTKLFKGTLVDTELRIVAFIDILGFKKIIEEYDSISTSNILKELHETLELSITSSIKSIIQSGINPDIKDFLEYRMFSDCICISLPFIEFESDFHIQFYSLSTIIQAYQTMMMQKGFFVRGGISIGSYFADKNMIFSGGLVKAVKIEEDVFYPVIGIDDIIIKKLEINFIKHSQGLFYDNLLISSDQCNFIFINFYSSIENLTRSFDFMQKTMDNIVLENNEEKNNPDHLYSYFKAASLFTKSLLDFTKSQIPKDSINQMKLIILEQIELELARHKDKILKIENMDSDDYKNENRIVSKYEFLKEFTEWSLSKCENGKFEYYEFKKE